MKPSALFIAGFLALITTTSVYAQYNYQAAARQAVANQAFHHFATMQMNQMMALSMRSRASVLNNPKIEYKVVLADGTEKVVKSKMGFDKNNISYLIFEDKNFKKNDTLRYQKIYPGTTKSVSKIWGYENDELKGMPADSCWLFKTVSGKLNAYSFLPETDYLDINYLKYIQKDDGPLQKVDEETLASLLADNEKAMNFYRKKKYFQAIKAYNK